MVIGDDQTVSDGWSVTGDQTSDRRRLATAPWTAGGNQFTAPATITVTANSTIATAGYVSIKLAAAGAVGTATITGCSTAGKLTILRNTTAQTITITDTSTIMLGGNAALAQYDTLDPDWRFARTACKSARQTTNFLDSFLGTPDGRQKHGDNMTDGTTTIMGARFNTCGARATTATPTGQSGRR
ncbi:hypothetical protein [Candidatus Amarolinea dominans]|uniref:hypothetical protein n=1 Tax=Candidatus Amarolinea dominans TaxID=3140696 RepID=UPI0031364B9E|nr:hypothetical protein [Anaerolineae bacterium]